MNNEQHNEILRQWLTALPEALQEEVKAHPELAEMSLEALVKGYIKAKTQASISDVQSADELPLTEPQEGEDWYGEDLRAYMQARMFEAGLDKAQAVQVHDGYLDFIREAVKISEESPENFDLDSVLDELWGKAKTRKENLMNSGLRFLGFKTKDLEPLLSIGDPQKSLELMVRIGEACAEDSLLGQGQAQNSGDARAELERLASDKEHRCAFLTPSHPAHNQAKALRAKLIQRALST